MRAFRPAVLGVALLFSVAAAADPVSGPGYDITVVRKAGAAFSGLAEDDTGLIVTDLATGRLYRFIGGVFEPFGPELPHGVDVIGDPTGPYRIASTATGYILSQGWTPVNGEQSALDHSLIEIGKDGAARVISSDFWNPFDFLVDGENLIVVDAARNSLEQLSGSGRRTTLFAFARLAQEGAAMQSLSPTEFKESQTYEVDAVPTGISAGGSRIFVSLFSGFPYVDGGGKIVSVDLGDPRSAPRVDLEGLNAPVDLLSLGDLAFILEHGRYDQATGFVSETGRLLFADMKRNVRQVVADRMTRPASFIKRRDGSLAIACLDGSLVFLTNQPGVPQ